MAFSTNGGGLKRGRYSGLSAMSEINVTPFVDVLLVVLVIFMITANVMEFGLEIEVPEVKTVKQSAKQLPIVTITKDSNLYLGEAMVNVNELAKAVRSRYPNQEEVYVRADKETTWDPIAQVVSQLGEAKLKVQIVTKAEDFDRRKRR
ncbi:MAG: ExbD/TolR family protein [Bryobacteraceae bacterium]